MSGCIRWSIGIVLIAGCATAPGDGLPAADEPRVAAPDGRTDLADVALMASGFTEAKALKRARAKFERLAGPIVAALQKVRDPRERAHRLLEALHKKGGLLGTYDARATTLKEILDRRRYNCVSASSVYNVLAHRLDLDVAAQLLPTHARTLLSIERSGGFERIAIETTSPHGFDPDAANQAKILRAVAAPVQRACPSGKTDCDNKREEARAIVPDAGSIVSTRVLIGTIYVNRASIAQEGGNFKAAEALFENGEAFAADSAMRQVLRDQRAALLSQLGADDMISEDETRRDRAYRTLLAAAELEPAEPRIRKAVHQNLRAAAERIMASIAASRDEAAIRAILKQTRDTGLIGEEHAGLTAFALSELARIRIDRKDFDGAADALHRGLSLQLAPEDQPLRGALEQNLRSALRLSAFAAAKRGDLQTSLSRLQAVGKLDFLERAQRSELREDKLRAVHLAGNSRIDAHDLVGAAEVYRTGARLFPGDETCRHNFVAVLERLSLPLVEQGRCTEADRHLEEIANVDRASTFPAEARSQCLQRRAKERLEAKDYVEAVRLLREAVRVRPEAATARKNLALALSGWIARLTNQRECQQARTLVKEAAGLRVNGLPPRSVRRAAERCGG